MCFLILKKTLCYKAIFDPYLQPTGSFSDHVNYDMQPMQENRCAFKEKG